MDLALHRGCSVAELEATTDERELNLWALYDAQRILPWRRLEQHLAQVALQVVRLGGDTKARLDDFLFKVRPVQRTTAAQAAGFKPRPKRRKD